ncbi:MAG: lamin tail domain-containing protein [Verrucomicrobiales bacterium]|nr:lamin tail domain-containing protein [Verrucomicrobiales bacterium]
MSLILGGALLGSSSGLAQQNLTNLFVIEAEDFNYARGQTLAVANQMPYLGGAFAGLNTAVISVDYNRTADASSPLYRNDSRIPILASTDRDREAWTMTTNFRLGALKGNEWFNYTRNLPVGRYLVYAAMSHGDTGPDLCQGVFSTITSIAATNTSQTTSRKGTFKGPGTGSYETNRLVILRDTANRVVILDLGGSNQTFRYTATSGFLDYLKLVRARPPVVGVQPADVTVTENRAATFSLAIGSDDPAAIQWQTNGVNVLRGTNTVLSFVPSLGMDGTRVRCVLTNVIGTTLSAEVTLHVVPDTGKPSAIRALSLGSDKVRLFFDEAVFPPVGAAAGFFSLSGGIGVTAAEAGADPTTIDLTLSSPLTFDQSYTVTLSGVRDIAATPNTILEGTQISFVAVQLVATDIGRPTAIGTLNRIPGGFAVSGAGSDIGGSSDQFGFSWEPRSGDFDLQGRIAKATITDAFLHVGLMARETLATNSVFAAALASSAQLGCFFEVRKTTGTATTVSSAGTGMPVNYPYTWLRLRRSGNLFSGYASLDGQSWVLLGTNSFTTISNTVLVGLALSSQSSSAASEAELRDYGNTVSTKVVTELPKVERLGPSSRRTGLVFSEIMYHPRSSGAGAPNLEFIEIYNAGSIFEELTGFEITGGIQYQFPAGYRLEAGAFLVIAADPSAVQNAYGLANVLGPWTGSLNNSGDSVQLKDARGALKLQVDYATVAPWPVGADGAGPSLVLRRPSYGEADPRAWASSEMNGGTPGQMEAILPSALTSIVINEFLAHESVGQVDFVELYNHSTAAVDLSGCYLSDDPTTNKFKIAAGTSLAARGLMSFDSAQLGFGLNSVGESIYLIDSTGTRVIDAVRFGPQEKGVSHGRVPDGATVIRPLATATPGASNSGWKPEAVVINEIMYNPITQDSNDEYVELHNRGTTPVDLAGWSFTSGIEYTIPTGRILAPGGYLVIAKNSARLLSKYGHLSAANTAGDYSGTLGNGGDSVVLSKPQTFDVGTPQNPATVTLPVVVSEVTYGTGGRWGKWADGGGSSLELIDPRADLQQAASWADSDETTKADWTTLDFTGVLDNGNGTYTPNRLLILLQGAGECQVDDVEVIKVGSTNLLVNGSFEATNTTQRWEMTGTHGLSTIDTNNGIGGSRSLHIRAQGDGDTGINSVRRALANGLASGNTGRIKAKVRWMAGWPEILLRLQGNWLELAGKMDVPPNLGSPGQLNSRRVDNAGPAIYHVSHSPALPRASEPVVVTCRVSDPDGVGAVTVRYRFDSTQTLTNVVMLDDGTGGDEVAGDGVYSGTVPGRASGIMAFRVEALDAAAVPAGTVFPAGAPAQECLVRFNDGIPFGSFGHYHLWSTAATESARGASTALNNFYRDATLVYGNGRIIYNVGFRDKGSPYHSGTGDFAITVPADDLLLGVRDRVFGATGNGGAEASGLRGRVANWFSRELGLSYLHAHYILFYRNGTLHQSISEDAEQPSNPYAEAWYPSGEVGELFKIAVWFEDNSTSGATGATMEQFRTTGGVFDLARYRWNWQLRANDSANNYTNFFKLVEAINASGDHVPGLMNIADMEEWMRVFAYHRMMGNWDSWTFNVGQNMYLYRQPGAKWVLLPWDIDFVLGLGNGPTDALWGGQDPVMNTRVYDNPTFRRMLYRAFLDGISGPMQPSRYAPQIDSRRIILSKNKISGLAGTADIGQYIDQRREYLRAQVAAANVIGLSITNNGGNNFVSANSVATITGRAPFEVATIEVNGIPYPVKWTGFTSYSISVPLANGANVLTLVGKDLRGNVVSGGSDVITVTYNGVPQQPSDFVVINEIHYNPTSPRGSFVELFNRSTTTPFDLSGYRLDGLSYVFPAGSLISPSSYMILAKSRADFALAYGSGITVWDEFAGSLDSGGERLSLVKPGETPDNDLVINDVRYDNVLPWPVQADGFGPSLQLVDATKDTYRVANWAATATNDLNRVTPGRTNLVRQTLPAFPLVWINEILPNNVNGATDNAGDREPFVELYNSGDVAVDLSSLYLTDSTTNLTRWPFPAGTTIAPKQFLTLWTDGEPNETAAGALHTPFRISPTNGFVALVRLQGNPSAPAVIDYIHYPVLPNDRSYGSFPDGEPRNRRSFFYVTQGGTNNPVYPDVNITLNEVMASNQKTLADPATGRFSDWFEIYNGGTSTVDLAGYRLTDNLTNSNPFTIPAGYAIPAGGFLLVWADGDPSLNQAARPDLHVDFQLSAGGEELALIAPDDRLVDGFRFPAQVTDYSIGRFPDGGPLPMVYMPAPTPRKKNDATNANYPPTLGAVSSKEVDEQTLLAFTVQATDPNVTQQLSYRLINNPPAGAAIDATTGRFTWTPTEEQGPGNFLVTIEAADNGTPSLAATVEVAIQVLEVNTIPGLVAIPSQTVVAGLPLRFTAVSTDSDVPEQIVTFALAGGSPLGAGINPDTGDFNWTPSAEQIGEYTMTIVVTDQGVPPLSRSVNVSITVKAPEVVVPPQLSVATAEDGSLTLSFGAENGIRYQVQYRDRLDEAAWAPFAEVLGVGAQATLSGIDPRDEPERYYRVVVQP